MGLKNKLLNKIVFLDTSPLIYFIEGNSVYNNQIKDLFLANSKGKITFQVSTLTLLEVLVQPLRLNKIDLANQYEVILTNSESISIYDIDVEISKQAAILRAKYNLKTPDSIQIATAIVKNANFFLSNDKDLKRVSEIEIIILEDFL